MNDLDVMSKEEVALLLECEPSTVEEAARMRELPGLKMGKGWVFPREALIKQINVIAMRGVGEIRVSPSPLAVALSNAKKGPPVLPMLT